MKLPPSLGRQPPIPITLLTLSEMRDEIKFWRHQAKHARSFGSRYAAREYLRTLEQRLIDQRHPEKIGARPRPSIAPRQEAQAQAAA